MAFRKWRIGALVLLGDAPNFPGCRVTGLILRKPASRCAAA
jgi:hypothetical protein